MIGAILTLALPERFNPRDTTLVLLALALDVAALLGAQIALGVGRTWIWSFRLAAKNIGLLVFVPLLFHLYGPPGVLVGLLLSSVAGVLVPGWTGFNFVRHAEHGVPIPEGAMRYGIVAGMSTLVGQLTYRGPIVATTILTGSAAETGFAALGAGIGMAIMFGVRELFTVSLPELVQRWGRDQKEAERALGRIGWRAEAALIPAAIAGVLLLGRGVPLVAGRQFTPAIGTLLPIMMLLPILPLPIIGYQGAALRLVRRSPSQSTSAVSSRSPWPPIPRAEMGALGATTALLVAVTAASVLTLWRLPSAVTPRLLLTAALASAGTLGVALVLGVAR